ncbi:unnamed protein product, partial [Rotaria sordida]
MTLSRLYIRIKYTYFLECLIEHIPALKQLSVEFNKTLNIYPRSELLIENLCQSNGNWYNKLPNLRHFTLKTFILNDVQFVYLKWLLNNLNHVQKLKLRLGSENLCRTDQIIWKSYIDANFVQQYCLPDIINNIIDFDLYICFYCQLLSIDVEKAFNQLKTNALSSVQYVEFSIPSCHRNSNESANIGKHLVPFLKLHMPHLQTLRLWRPDDFPWTTVRPDLPEGYYRKVLLQRWMKFLHTSESIAQQVTVFEQDLCQLVEQLKYFVFLDIYGVISYEKAQAYHSM